MTTLEEKFAARVGEKEQAERYPGIGQCVLWIGSRSKKGYGKFYANGRDSLAHRVAYSLENKCEVPASLVVMHICDNPSCVNPTHLRLGTNQDNIDDKVSKGRQSRTKPIAPYATGEKHGRSKLTEKDVSLIRELHASGSSTRALANEFGVTSPQISRICTRKQWRH